MKASELRLNNYVLEDGDVVLLATNYDLFKCLVNVDRGIGFEPIPLTEEWLLKFGFTHQYKTIKGHDFFEYPIDSKFKLYVNLNKMELIINKNLFGCILTKKIQYVHALQNFYFELTEEELLIKNEKK